MLNLCIEVKVRPQVLIVDTFRAIIDRWIDQGN